MGAWWKVIAGVVLLVPLLAYVVGPLTPSDADRGDRSRPVVVGDGRPPAPPVPAPPSADDEDDSPGADGDTDEGARVNSPEPRRLEGRDDEDDQDDDAEADDAGEGSGQRDDDTDDADDGSDGADDEGDDD